MEFYRLYLCSLHLSALHRYVDIYVGTLTSVRINQDQITLLIIANFWMTSRLFHAHLLHTLTKCTATNAAQSNTTI